MPLNIRFVSTYPPRRCGIGTFCRDLASALEQFPAEIGHIRVAAIAKKELNYNIPVDLIIEQENAESWKHAALKMLTRIDESPDPTVVVLQHEFGLDSNQSRNAQDSSYLHMARTFSENKVTCLVYLHTVLENPNDAQRQIIIDLAECSDGLIVTTESAIDILESDTYGISHFKLKHIDHGIRMHHPTEYDRYDIKEQLGLTDMFLITTLGLLSPGKGIQYGIRAYARFLQESCTESQRQHLVYLIAGQCHPDFVVADGGSYYREFMREVNQALEQSGLVWTKTRKLEQTDWQTNDLVFYDDFLDESELLKLYGATNAMVLPYLNTEQISSGILADTIGSGRIAIATKFRYAMELIYSNIQCPPGLIIGRYARGILVDPGPDAIEQIAQGLDFVVFEKQKRLRMEKQAHQRGYQMRWANSAWALIQYVEFINEEKQIPTGRGIVFLRKKKSILQFKQRKAREKIQEETQTP